MTNPKTIDMSAPGYSVEPISYDMLTGAVLSPLPAEQVRKALILQRVLENHWNAVLGVPNFTETRQ